MTYGIVAIWRDVLGALNPQSKISKRASHRSEQSLFRLKTNPLRNPSIDECAS